MDDTIETGLAPDQRESLREQLVADRASASDLIGSLTSMLDSFNAAQRGLIADDEHDPEGPSIAVQRSEATALLAQSRHHLELIDRAVERMENGGYGICENCHGEIPFARLEARPHSIHCKACAERLG